MKRLELCEGHKQEWKQSHYAEHNCDYCKLKSKYDKAVKALRYYEENDYVSGKEAELILKRLGEKNEQNN